jgi:hypothetical protein
MTETSGETPRPEMPSRQHFEAEFRKAISDLENRQAAERARRSGPQSKE